MNNKHLKEILFWITLSLAIGIVLAGFVAEKQLNYSLLTYPKIKYGSYGFKYAKIPSRAEVDNKRLIVLLGNSVYQFNRTPQYMQLIADELHNPVAFVNLSQTSSSVYDYLPKIAEIASLAPDLVVICMNDGTFSLNPKFKTDSDQYVFDPDILKSMPPSFYSRYFTYQTATDSALSSLIPLKRADPILRWSINLYYYLPRWFLQWLSYPDLQIPKDENFKAIQMTQLEKTSSDEKFITLQEILAILDKHKIPVLFIWQEADQEENVAQNLEMTSIIKNHDNALFADLSSDWNKNDFRDSLHPKQKHESRYAMRHYLLINNALAYFDNKKIGQGQ